MGVRFSEPRIISRGPYTVVGAWAPYQGEDESPGWAAANAAFWAIAGRVPHRPDDLVLGFLYRPHGDDPTIASDVQACCVGVEVTSLAGQPEGVAVTHFSGGEYVLVDCIGDTEDQAAQGVGEAIGMLMEWIPAHGYVEGDACFAAGCESAPRPPWIETVYIKLEPASQG